MPAKSILFSVVMMSAVLCGCGPSGKATEGGADDEGLTILAALNDTGTLACADGQGSDAECPRAQYPGQDGELGRDAQMAQGILTKVGGGLHGFDWSKLGHDGSELAVQNAPWSESGVEANGERWSCVRDNVTGLIWEVKESDHSHPRYGGNVYTWYQSDESQNGGYAGVEAVDVVGCPTAPCNTEHYVQWVNEQGLCGFQDWRMPNVSELLSIAVNSELLPALDKQYFPNATLPRFFSKNTVAYDVNLAWYVYFTDASVSATNKSDPSHIRLVRSQTK